MPIRAEKHENQWGVETEKVSRDGDSFQKIEESRKDFNKPPDGGPPVSQRNNVSDDILIRTGENERQFAAEKLGIKEEVALSDAMRFKGALPEVVNGRLAMLGVIAALGSELVTGRHVAEQVQYAPWVIAFTFAAVIIGSVVPVLKGAKRIGSPNGTWTPEAETLNGRVAMLGFVALLATNYFSSGSV